MGGGGKRDINFIGLIWVSWPCLVSNWNSIKAMSRLISTIISGVSRPHFPFVVLESSLVQSSLPVLRAFVGSQDATTHVLLFSLLYPPSTLAGVPRREGLHVVDRTADVPGYSETSDDLAEFILNRAKQGINLQFTHSERFCSRSLSDSPRRAFDGHHRLGRCPMCRPRVAIQIIRPHRRSPFQCIVSSQ